MLSIFVVVFLVGLIGLIVVFGRLHSEALEGAQALGPAGELAQAPVVAQGRMKWKSTRSWDRSNPEYRIEIRAEEGVLDTHRKIVASFESTFGIGSLRNKGMVAVDLRDGQLTGRQTNGTSLYAVRGELTPAGGTASLRLEVDSFAGTFRETVAIDGEGDRFRVRQGSSSIEHGELHVEQGRRLIGSLTDILGNLKITLNFRQLEAVEIALILLLAVKSVHTLEGRR
ncbi:MAG: hypothetical protein AAF725_21190 [Acidobacteriota bacterium]